MIDLINSFAWDSCLIFILPLQVCTTKKCCLLYSFSVPEEAPFTAVLKFAAEEVWIFWLWYSCHLRFGACVYFLGTQCWINCGVLQFKVPAQTSAIITNGKPAIEIASSIFIAKLLSVAFSLTFFCRFICREIVIRKHCFSRHFSVLTNHAFNCCADGVGINPSQTAGSFALPTVFVLNHLFLFAHPSQSHSRFSTLTFRKRLLEAWVRA